MTPQFGPLCNAKHAKIKHTKLWMLRAANKIAIDGCPHLVSLLICEVQHPRRVLLAPMLKPVTLDFTVMLLTICVDILLGVVPNAIFVKPMVFGYTVVEVQGEDGLVQ